LEFEFFLRLFGERVSLVIALLIDSSSAYIYPLIPAEMPYLLYPLFVFRSFALLSSPVLQGMISKEFPSDKQGELAGVLAGIKTITTFIGPFIFNNLFSYYVTDEPFPFGEPTPGVGFFIAATIFFFFVL